jgi:hypothetical protein
MVREEATKLAPTLKEQAEEQNRRVTVLTGIEKAWGKEKFDAIASDLDDAFGGLSDTGGRPKPAIEAVFESSNPAKLIEYLADPENAEVAERLSGMSGVRAGLEVARIEAKLGTEKPQVSKAPAPLSAVRGKGTAIGDPATMTDAEFAQWRKRQISQRR